MNEDLTSEDKAIFNRIGGLKLRYGYRKDRERDIPTAQALDNLCLAYHRNVTLAEVVRRRIDGFFWPAEAGEPEDPKPEANESWAIY